MDLHIAHQLADTLITKHGLKDKGWCFKFDNAKRRFGCCKYGKKQITLSTHLTHINNETKVVDTILHEIAHALTPGHGHDSVWRRKAVEIGSSGNRCYDSREVTTPESKYVATCNGCGHTHKAHRRVTRSKSCGYCSGGRYNPEYKLTFVLNA